MISIHEPTAVTPEHKLHLCTPMSGRGQRPAQGPPVTKPHRPPRLGHANRLAIPCVFRKMTIRRFPPGNYDQ